jgi:hypothetical protein
VTRPQRAYALGVIVALGLMALVHSWGYGPLYVLGVAAAAALAIVFLPRWIIALGEQASDGLHAQVWKRAEGRHHAFGGVTFDIVDDGRHVWMHGDALKRVLARPEIDERQRLWLRVDAVVEHLARFPGRMDPRVQKLRRWLERDVLYPAGRRHAR